MSDDESLRRSQRIKNKSGQNLEYQGKYNENKFFSTSAIDNGDNLCSAKCLQNKISSVNIDKQQFKGIKSAAHVQFMRAFKSPPVVKGSASKTKKVGKTVLKRKQNKELVLGSNVHKAEQLNQRRRKALFRSKTVENLSDMSIDSTNIRSNKDYKKDIKVPGQCKDNTNRRCQVASEDY